MIANRMKEFTPSGIRAVMAMAQEREQQGAELIHMEVGQPQFDTPDHIKRAVADACSRPVPGYTPNLGTGRLRELVAERVASRNGVNVSGASVGITAGAVMGLSLAIQATVDPGDEVLVPDPGWPNYRSAVTLAGGQVVPYRLDRARGFSIDVGRIESLLTPRTRMIIVNSPGNPTGVVAERESVLELVDLADRNGIFVLSDEVYEDIVFRGTHHSILMNGMSDRLILVSGVSKSYAMTGWRIGWIVAPEEVVDAAAKLVEPLISCPASVSQIAAEAALVGPQDCVSTMRDAYDQGGEIVSDILGPLGVMATEPGGAFYALIDISGTGQSSAEFVRGLMESKNVTVAPGATFGESTEGYVRLSTALSQEPLAEGCRRIRDYVQESAGALTEDA